MTRSRALWLAFLLASAPAVTMATTAADLCSLVADPCQVSTTVAITPGSLLDFGTRELRLMPTAKVSFGNGILTIKAGKFTMMPGAQLLGTDPTSGGNLVVRTTGPVDIQGAGTKQATIDVSSAGDAGLIDIATSTSTINLDGELFGNGNGTYANGGTINLHAVGNITIGNGQITVLSGPQGFGGDIAIFADLGTIDAKQIIDSSGGDGGGGTIDIEAGGDVITRAKLDVGGGGFAGDGGAVTLIAGGSVQMLGPEYGPAVGDDVNGGGDGADLTVIATNGSVLLAGLVTNTGGTPDGGGGSASIQAGTTITQNGNFQLGASGIDTCGGDTDFTAGGNITLDGIDVSGGSCGAGSVTVVSNGTVSVPQPITGDSPDIGLGPSILFNAATINLTGQIRGTGPISTVDLQACTITMGGSAILKSLGMNSINRLEGSGQISLLGTVTAGASGTNRFAYADPSKVPTFKANLVSPAPQLVLDATLPPCAGATTTTTTTPTTTITLVSTTTITVTTSTLLTTTSTTATTLVSTSTLLTTTSTSTTVTTTSTTTSSTSTTTTTTTSTTAPPTTTTLPGDLLFPTRSAHNGCFFEWRVRNPGGAISNGQPSTTQTCVDGDPSCDMDGVSNGVCTFAVSACLGANDSRLTACQPTSIDAVDVQHPSPLSPIDMIEQDNATVLVGALQGLGVKVTSQRHVLQDAPPVTQRNLCTNPVGMEVPHAPGLIGKRIFLANASSGRQRQRRNRLTLVCAPNTAVCGNGVTEIGEQCDDGNHASCDGCSSSCKVEACGNGVVECNEQCDEGAANGTPGSNCTSTCTVPPPPLRIPGGGAKTSDCQLEYAMAFASPAVDKKGIPSYKQNCVDGDPTCDFDPTPGNCRFHMWACAGGADTRLQCAADTVASASLTKPVGGPIATALGGAIAGLPFPVGPGETCTAKVDVDVPLGRKQTVVEAQSRDTTGIQDKDKLRLGCIATAKRHRK